MNSAQINEMFRRFSALNPAPRTELEYTNPYTLLVAVVLSAQATDAGVNRATRHLFPVADTPEKMLVLGEEGLRDRIKTINFFNTKTKNVLALSRMLVEKHGSQVPRDREALESLPGVGRKTANVILNTVFGETSIGVDTHIFRVANRTGLAKGKTPVDVEKKLDRIVPASWKKDAHHWMVLHGRYICKARKPLCPKCPIVDLCAFPDKTPPETLP